MIGNTEPHGGATLEDGGRGMTICTGQGILGGTADAFHFVYWQVSGDAALSARIGALEGSQTVARVGVMFRDGLEPDARCAVVCFTRPLTGATVKLHLRESPGSSFKAIGETVSGADVPSVWLRIEKRGEEISGHASTDGNAWTELGRKALPGLSASCSVGVLATGGFTSTNARSLRADIQDLSLVDCQGDIDTFCTGIEVAGPQGDGPGLYTATASAEDASGDSISYLFTADDGLGNLLMVGPQAQNAAEFDLTEGTWTVSVAADDQPFCLAGSTGRLQTVVDVVAPGGLQLPGDTHGDGVVDLSDAVATLGFLFLGSPTLLPCGDGSASDPANLKLLDWQPDGGIDLSDAVATLSLLFLGGSPPALGTECVRIEGCPEGAGCP